MDGQTGKHMNERMDRWTDRWMSRWTAGVTNGWMEGHLNRWMDRQMDAWPDGPNRNLVKHATKNIVSTNRNSARIIHKPSVITCSLYHSIFMLVLVLVIVLGRERPGGIVICYENWNRTGNGQIIG